MKLRVIVLAFLAGCTLYAQQSAEANEQEKDPFADVKESAPSPTADAQSQRSWSHYIFGDNFGFRREIMSQFNTSDGRGGSRQSVGFEVLKKWSTATSTVASFNFQGRFVRRDGYRPVQNDRMTDPTAGGWTFEYHNFYGDLYNVFNPVLSDAQRRANVGRFNFRAGRFYVPFGLNLQTDTHGTVLQLSNESNFGFERDWYTGFWGAINQHLNYDAYYLTGSGYDLKYKGQSGLGVVRISLGNRYSTQYGLEGGASAIAGERLTNPMMNAGIEAPLATKRYGIDARYRRAVPNGLLTFSTELSRGRDARDTIRNQLYQAEYLHSSRRWGLGAQYRDLSRDGMGRDSSIIGEFTFYLKNDVGNSNLHWIKFNVEQPLEQSPHGLRGAVFALQYYFYW
ncbi:MAG: hypothetical protein IT168_11310 [Bryobacterales bacterium]|nr:hypothetical protein [Bryobacterales bacterium]